MDDSFVKAPLSVPKSSGFDKSHQNLLSSKVGTITPILFDELIPGSKVHCRLALSASLPPLASETFMRCSIKTEAFFVPMRLLSASFENFFTGNPKQYFSTGGIRDLIPELPYISPGNDASANAFAAKMGPGSLADYLGFKLDGPIASFLQFKRLSALPFLAYQRVYSDWYRNSLVQREAFLPLSGTPTNPVNSNVCAAAYPFIYTSVDGGYPARVEDIPRSTLADGMTIFDLRQRNFGLDYFTTATPEPQQGTAQVVSFDTSGTSGQFSIASLRASNSLQQFKERNELLGSLYVEQLNGRYGVRPSDGIAQRSIYLGRGEFEVYSKGIYAQSDIEGNNTNNPFTSVGTRYGSAYASGSNFVVNFEAKEPGYFFVMATLVPRVTYSSGIDRALLRYAYQGTLVEMANPILQNVGPEPIYTYELNGEPVERVFGYTDRYASFKTKQDQLHGLLRDGQSLQSFALQRSFSASGPAASTLGINGAFLRIPTDYLDQVAAVADSISGYGYWMDCAFDYKVAMPIQKYSLPSLQDPAYEHGRTVVVSRGGSKL